MLEYTLNFDRTLCLTYTNKFWDEEIPGFRRRNLENVTEKAEKTFWQCILSKLSLLKNGDFTNLTIVHLEINVVIVNLVQKFGK